MTILLLSSIFTLIEYRSYSFEEATSFIRHGPNAKHHRSRTPTGRSHPLHRNMAIDAENWATYPLVN